MIPTAALDLTTLETAVYPSLTYKLDLQTKRIGNKIDGVEAAIQSVTKVLMTERYANVMYSGNYGVELEDLIGKDFEYIQSDLRRRLESALLVDDRIQEVSTVTLTKINENVLEATCTVTTIDGAFTISTEVTI